VIDLDVGSVSFIRNGCDMGVAFTDIRRPLAYYPAVSLSYGARHSCSVELALQTAGAGHLQHQLPCVRQLAAACGC